MPILVDKALTYASALGCDDRNELLLRDPDLCLRFLDAGNSGAHIKVEAPSESDEVCKIFGFKGCEVVWCRGGRRLPFLIEVQIWHFNLRRRDVRIEDGTSSGAGKCYKDGAHRAEPS